MRSRAAGLLAAVLAGCGGDDGSGGAGGDRACQVCSSPQSLPAPENAEISEASGLVASATHAGIYYVHNDAGDDARFFAIGEDGADHGTFALDGRTAVDMEDAASGPCSTPGTACLYLADIGDNDLTRSSYTIYRVEEPASTSAGLRSVTAEAFPFSYPDGSHDSEAMFVDHESGSLVVLTKDASGARAYVYRPPLQADQAVELESLGAVSVADKSVITGASMGRNGEGILVRTKNDVWHYPVSGGFEQALAQAPCELTSPGEANGEAIAWATDGLGYRTISEGSGARLMRVDCQ